MLQYLKNTAVVLGVALISGTSYGQANALCANMEPICTNAGLNFTANAGGGNVLVTEPGNNYGCLGFSPNPAWYYLEIATAGNIDMSLTAPQDIDFIIWGPFTDLAAAQGNCGVLGNGGSGQLVVDCSYSSTNMETPQILNAQVGEVYIMLITNYANSVQDLTLTQTGGTGATDCNIVQPDPCVSDPGTFTTWKDPVGAAPNALTIAPIYLCEGDAFSVLTNNDFILPNDTIPQPIGDGIYSAQLMWLVYDAAPISGDPGADPGFLSYIIPNDDLMDINNAGSPIVTNFGCGTYWFVPVAGDDGIGGNGGVANGTNDNGGLDWDKNGNNCYLLGTPIEVTYACPIITATAVNCNPPGTINGMDVDISGGVGPYTIVNTGAGNLVSSSVPSPGTATVTDLQNNSGWSITITDDEGCLASASGTFSAPVITSIVLTPAPDCPLGGTGDVDVVVSGTSGQGAPYTIVMAGDPPTVGTVDSYSDNAGTIVPIVVADAAGCISDSTVTIPSAGHFIDLTIISVQGEDCYGDGNGAATIQGIPTPSGTVTSIVWTDPLGADDPNTGPSHTTQNGMMPGIWVVCVTDDIGCEFCIPVEITAPQELDIFVENANEPVCFEFSDGSIDVGVSGGTQPITITWSHDLLLTGDVANTIGAGTYTAYVMDGNGCIDSVTHIMGQPDSLHGFFTIKDIDCFGQATGGIICDSVAGAFGNFTYNWNMNGLVPNPPNNFNTAGNLPAGTYVMTLNDDHGCTKQYEWTLTENPEIVLVQFGTEEAYCRLFGFQKGNGVVFASAAGGVPSYTYEWMNLTDSTTSPNTTWGGLNPATYQITVWDALGCILVRTIQLDSLNPIAAFTATSPQFLVPGECEGTAPVNVSFTNQSMYFANPNNPNADTTFYWNLDYNNASWYISHDINEAIDTTYVGEETFTVCLIATNKNECADTTCKDIIVHDQPKLETPNVFTPGIDGANDNFTFLFKSQAVETFSAVIVDRWGQEIITFSDINQMWNGDSKSGAPCSDGVYFYTYEVVFTNGEQDAGQGNITLIRE